MLDFSLNSSVVGATQLNSILACRVPPDDPSAAEVEPAGDLETRNALLDLYTAVRASATASRLAAAAAGSGGTAYEADGASTGK